MTIQPHAIVSQHPALLTQENTAQHRFLTGSIGVKGQNQVLTQFLQRGDAASAVTILRWATIIAPGSANAWDSYAEASLAAGDRETALSASRKSLELIPTDSTSGEALLNILRETVPQRISDLEAETN